MLEVNPQLSFDDVDGCRLTAFATNRKLSQYTALELRQPVSRSARLADGAGSARSGVTYGKDDARLPGAGPRVVTVSRSAA